MVVGEDGGLAVEFIEVRGLDDGITVAGEVAVALVICDDDDDVWPLGGEKGEWEECEE